MGRERIYNANALRYTCIAIGIIIGVVWLSFNCKLLSNVCGEANFTGDIETSGQFFTPPDGFAEQNVLQVFDNTIIIGRDCLAIVAETSSERAEAISQGLSNITPLRPTSYDGWVSTLQAFNITFEAVTLYGFQDDYYLSRAYFRKGVNVLDLDMKPSDAMALALRAHVPIYVNLSLLRNKGQNICRQQ